MANLTDTATFEDLTSAEGRAAFDAFYAGLATRTAGKFKALHVLVDHGFYWSVDFDIAREDLDSLVTACETELMAKGFDDPIAAQPRASWWQFWIAPLIGIRFVKMRGHRSMRQFCILRGHV